MTATRFRPYDRFGWHWRERRTSPGSRTWVIQIHVKHQLDLDDITGTEPEVLAAVMKAFAEAGVEEAKMTADIEFGTYGDRDRDVLMIVGWRDATEDEISEREAQVQEFEQQKRDREEKEIERLRKERPDLFK